MMGVAEIFCCICPLCLALALRRGCPFRAGEVFICSKKKSAPRFPLQLLVPPIKIQQRILRGFHYNRYPGLSRLHFVFYPKTNNRLNLSILLQNTINWQKMASFSHFSIYLLHLTTLFKTRYSDQLYSYSDYLYRYNPHPYHYSRLPYRYSRQLYSYSA